MYSSFRQGAANLLKITDFFKGNSTIPLKPVSSAISIKDEEAGNPVFKSEAKTPCLHSPLTESQWVNSRSEKGTEMASLLVLPEGDLKSNGKENKPKDKDTLTMALEGGQEDRLHAMLLTPRKGTSLIQPTDFTRSTMEVEEKGSYQERINQKVKRDLFEDVVGENKGKEGDNLEATTNIKTLNLPIGTPSITGHLSHVKDVKDTGRMDEYCDMINVTPETIGQSETSIDNDSNLATYSSLPEHTQQTQIAFQENVVHDVECTTRLTADRETLSPSLSDMSTLLSAPCVEDSIPITSPVVPINTTPSHQSLFGTNSALTIPETDLESFRDESILKPINISIMVSDSDDDLPVLFPTPDKIAASVQATDLNSNVDSTMSSLPARRVSTRIKIAKHLHETEAIEQAIALSQERARERNVVLKRSTMEVEEKGSYQERLSKRVRLDLFDDVVGENNSKGEVEAKQSTEELMNNEDSECIVEAASTHNRQREDTTLLDSNMLSLLDNVQLDDHDIWRLKKEMMFGGLEQYVQEWSGIICFETLGSQYGVFPSWLLSYEQQRTSFGRLWTSLGLDNADWSIVRDILSSGCLTDLLAHVRPCPPDLIRWLLQLDCPNIMYHAYNLLEHTMAQRLLYQLQCVKDDSCPLLIEDLITAWETLGGKTDIVCSTIPCNGSACIRDNDKTVNCLSPPTEYPINNLQYFLRSLTAIFTYTSAINNTGRDLGIKVMCQLCRVSMDRITDTIRVDIHRCVSAVTQSCLDQEGVNELAILLAKTTDSHQGLVRMAQLLPKTGRGRQLQLELGRVLTCMFMIGPTWIEAQRSLLVVPSMEEVAAAIERVVRTRHFPDYYLVQSAALSLLLCLDTHSMTRIVIKDWLNRINCLHGAIRDDGGNLLASTKAKDTLMQIVTWLTNEMHARTPSQQTVADMFARIPF